MKHILYALLLLFVSLSLCLVMGEVILRAKIDPIDYLHPEIMNDPVLGVRIRPYSAGHDSWGYRNKSVPEKADIVAIGDSQTYGVSARSRSAWPSLLQEMTGKTVYNLSLPGYDPVDYYYLMQTEAFRLNPSVIIVGFYLGNDLSEVYRNVYSRRHWEGLRKADFVPEKDIVLKSVESIAADEARNRFLGSLRGWLAHNSILYRITTFYFADIIKFAGNSYKNANNGVTIFEDTGTEIRTSFTPSMRLGALDISDQRIQEGMRISLEVFNMMKKSCEQKKIRFIVLLIPTKESVFAGYIENKSELTNSAVINELILKERSVNELIKAEFNKQGIPFIESLGPLSRAIGKKQIYPYFDGHPNGNGYRIIAETAAEFIHNADTNRR